MAKSREIKKRMKAVANIRRITKTMQMIATSKFARAQQASLATKPYTEALLSLVGELASMEGASHPLLSGVDRAKGKPELTLILTSERGLCGPYNGSILRATMRHLRSTPAASSGAVEVVGRKGLIVLKFNKVDVARHHTVFGDKPQYEDVERLAQEYIDRYIAGEFSSVRVIYMRYISAGKQSPEVLQLLPFKPSSKPEGAATNVQFEFSPDEGELLGAIIPAAVKSVLFQAFNDAIVSEHVARMVAMKAATDNAGKMGKALSRKFNRARQAQITTELTEIISGAAALA
ncbi:MAG: ATP synthase F1 subunit gamma [Phycisphaeraceae bacterium]|nr:ATP synthase F1 subunit gamma [Phycisphaeraceae bacterium]MCW5753596.1 ATP synthase F1 subunit gamma [Phycisphaeraceae bacterium]